MLHVCANDGMTVSYLSVDVDVRGGQLACHFKDYTFNLSIQYFSTCYESSFIYKNSFNNFLGFVPFAEWW